MSRKRLQFLRRPLRVFLENGGDLMTAVRKEENTDRIWYVLYGYNRIHTGEGLCRTGKCRPEGCKAGLPETGESIERVADVALSGNGRIFAGSGGAAVSCRRNLCMTEPEE